jgi:hypothetical protein
MTIKKARNDAGDGDAFTRIDKRREPQPQRHRYADAPNWLLSQQCGLFLGKLGNATDHFTSDVPFLA